mmetsp:Transcript_8458/g.24368  ORF Transcript_8458/g.24368 Transcript_8458/m.24368 type:complete len:241 (-) Transcript_8458:114-836(-)
MQILPDIRASASIVGVSVTLLPIGAGRVRALGDRGVSGAVALGRDRDAHGLLVLVADVAEFWEVVEVEHRFGAAVRWLRGASGRARDGKAVLLHARAVSVAALRQVSVAQVLVERLLDEHVDDRFRDGVQALGRDDDVARERDLAELVARGGGVLAVLVLHVHVGVGGREELVDLERDAGGVLADHLDDVVAVLRRGGCGRKHLVIEGADLGGGSDAGSPHHGGQHAGKVQELHGWLVLC